MLVSAVLVQQPQHAASLALYAQSDKRSTCCGLHSIAETYATLTGLPAKLRMTAQQALLFLEDIRARLTIVRLDEQDYFSTIASFATRDLLSGAIYDALLARCAINCGAEALYTWNVSDFQRFGPEVSRLVRTP